MMDQFPGRVEDQKAKTLGPGSQQLWRQRQPLERRQHVVGQHAQSQPGGIGSQAAARHDPTCQFILDHIVEGFNRAGFLPMPLQQSLRRPLPNVADYGEVFHHTAIGKQRLLFLANTNGYIAQRLAIGWPASSGT